MAALLCIIINFTLTTLASYLERRINKRGHTSAKADKDAGRPGDSVGAGTL